MTTPSSSQLTSMRNGLIALMETSCVIERATKTPDGKGGWTESWATHATTVCIAEAVGPSDERLYGETVVGRATMKFQMPWNTDIKAEDRIVADGRTFYLSGPPYKDITWRIEVVCFGREFES